MNTLREQVIAELVEKGIISPMGELSPDKYVTLAPAETIISLALRCKEAEREREDLRLAIAGPSFCASSNSAWVEIAKRRKWRDTVIHPMVADVQSELATTRQKLKEAEEKVRELEDSIASVKYVDFEEGKRLNFGIGGEGAKIFAEIVSGTFFQNGGQNFLEVSLRDKKGNNFSLNIQKVDGKTPAQLKKEAEEKVAELQSELTRLREAVRWRKYPDEKPTVEGEYLTNHGENYWWNGEYPGWHTEDSAIDRWLPLPPHSEGEEGKEERP